MQLLAREEGSGCVEFALILILLALVAVLALYGLVPAARDVLRRIVAFF